MDLFDASTQWVLREWKRVTLTRGARAEEPEQNLSCSGRRSSDTDAVCVCPVLLSMIDGLGRYNVLLRPAVRPRHG